MVPERLRSRSSSTVHRNTVTNVYIPFREQGSHAPYMRRRPCQHVRHMAATPPGPSVTLDHPQASHNPPRAALGPCVAPKDANLAPARSHRPAGERGAQAALARRPPVRAPRAPEAHRPRCRQRSGPCRPPLHASGGRRGAFGPRAGPWRPPRQARWACGGGTGTTQRPAHARQTGLNESWATQA